MTIHVVPLGDGIQHDTDDDGDCVCGPTTSAVFREDGSTGWVVAHHSLDGREHAEPDHDREACRGCRARPGTPSPA